jgi:Na+/melibiose symporter-like transporter
VRKGAFGVTAGLTGLALGATGFQPGAPTQDPATVLSLRALFGLFPGLCFLLGTVLFLRRFHFGEAEHAAVLRALSARRAAPAGAPSSAADRCR